MKITAKELLVMTVPVKQLACVILWVILVCCAFSACARPKDAGTVAKDHTPDCLAAAQNVLGPEAEVKRCSNLEKEVVEAIAIVRLKQFAENKEGIPITKLVILRQTESRWEIALDVAKQIRNPNGYVGIDYIDDSEQYPGFRIAISERGKQPFMLALSYMRRDGGSEGIPIYISWNSATGRFQELISNEGDPDRFKDELRNPPRISRDKHSVP